MRLKAPGLAVDFASLLLDCAADGAVARVNVSRIAAQQ